MASEDPFVLSDTSRGGVSNTELSKDSFKEDLQVRTDSMGALHGRMPH